MAMVAGGVVKPLTISAPTMSDDRKVAIQTIVSVSNPRGAFAMEMQVIVSIQRLFGGVDCTQ